MLAMYSSSFTNLVLHSTATYYTFTKWVSMRDNEDYQGDIIFTTNLDYYANLADTWLALGKLHGLERRDK